MTPLVSHIRMFSRRTPRPGIVLGAGYRARARAAENHAHLVHPFARELQRVQQGRPGDDRRAVLVVMEHRDLHGAPQLFLDQETLRRFDVFQVDAAEGRLEQLAGANDLLRIQRRQLDIEDIDIGKTS